MTIKFITEDDKKGLVTFADVATSQFYIDLEGRLCQKLGNDFFNVIAAPNGIPLAQRGSAFNNPNRVIQKILPQVTKITWGDECSDKHGKLEILSDKEGITTPWGVLHPQLHLVDLPSCRAFGSRVDIRMKSDDPAAMYTSIPVPLHIVKLMNNDHTLKAIGITEYLRLWIFTKNGVTYMVDPDDRDDELEDVDEYGLSVAREFI